MRLSPPRLTTAVWGLQRKRRLHGERSTCHRRNSTPATESLDVSPSPRDHESPPSLRPALARSGPPISPYARQTVSVPEGGPRLHLFVERLPRRESAPEATARRSTERVFRWWDYALFCSLTLINFGAVYYFLSYWFERSNWIEHRLLLVALTVPTLVSLVLYESRWIALPLMRKPRERPPTPGWSIAVATTFVPGAEPLGMLEETVTALAALAYPHDTWVLDEGDDEEVKALCRRLGAFHFTPQNLPRYHTESGPFERP